MGRSALNSTSKIAAVFFCALLGVVRTSAAQDSNTLNKTKSKWPGEQGATWQSIAKLPNWQGAWVLDHATFERGVQTVTNPNKNPYSAPLNAKWEAYRLSNSAANGGQGPQSGTKNNATSCLPDGMPALMSAPHVFMFFFSPGLVSIVAEHGEYRLIHTDERQHPDDPDYTWDGHSIGHWEGGTLVVDTVAIKPQAEVFMGMPNASNNTHVVERYHLDKQAKKILIDVVVTNPDQFTQPYAYTNTLEFASKGMLESYCNENNRDTDRGETDLKPPGER